MALKRCSAAWVPLRPLYVLKQEFEPMSPKCRHVNATSTQRLPACLQEALRALLARRTSPSLALFFNIADRLYYFFTQIRYLIFDLKVPSIPCQSREVPVFVRICHKRCARARRRVSPGARTRGTSVLCCRPPAQTRRARRTEREHKGPILVLH